MKAYKDEFDYMFSRLNEDTDDKYQSICTIGTKGVFFSVENEGVDGVRGYSGDLSSCRMKKKALCFFHFLELIDSMCKLKSI